MSHFKLISSTKASDIIPVNKYVSEKTGLTVIIADVEGPLVNGYFCLGNFYNIALKKYYIIKYKYVKTIWKYVLIIELHV